MKIKNNRILPYRRSARRDELKLICHYLPLFVYFDSYDTLF